MFKLSSILCAGAAMCLVAGGCSMGYGPAADHSKFVTARLLEDGRTAVFSYHHFVYRPAAGLRAFPDGGIPKYLVDINVLGSIDIPTQKVKVLFAEKNKDWAHGSGELFIAQVSGRKVLIQRGGQTRDLKSFIGQNMIIDVDTGACEVVPLKEELARAGREYTEMYLVNADGTIVFVTAPAGAADTPDVRRDLRVRKPGGSYLTLAETAHYEACSGGEVYYWVQGTRQHHAFNVQKEVSRPAPEFRIPEMQVITNGVIVNGSRNGLEFGTKQNDQWTYSPLPVDIEVLKKAR